MSDELALARRYVEQTDVSLFLTGKAGTGKTTFLRDIDDTCNKRHIVVAPTGVAAVNAGGVTIHSFFQLPFDPYLPDVPELVTEYQMPDHNKSLSRNKLNIIRSLELLIIDEVSMVRADLLDAIDATLRRHRHSGRPFGGVQLLMIGDVHQLAPVVTERERPYMERVYPSPYFFNSKALQRLNYVTIELTTVYRQQDATFVDLLNNVRTGHLNNNTLAVLNSRVNTHSTNHSSLNIPITLTTHNRQADAINSRHMQALTGESRTFDAKVRGNFADSAMPVDEHLTIKVGERVMLIKNDSSGAHRYYNGKLATVTAFIDNDDGTFVEVIDDDGDIINVGHEVWENIRYHIDDKSGEIQQEVDGTFSQYPLRPAWAVTIHKAQGLTFDRVVIDAADAFAFGQVYVALSRCRSLEGLTLTSPLTPGVAFNDSGVEHFVDSQPPIAQVRQSVEGYERQYYYDRLTDLFNLDLLMVDTERAVDIYNRLKNIYPQNVEAIQHLRDTMASLASVGERFRSQLLSLTPEQHTDRVAKACDYFLPQLEAFCSALAALTDVEIDNKETRRALGEAVATLNEHLTTRLACLLAVKEHGFSVDIVKKAERRVQSGERKAEPKRRTTGKSEKKAPKNLESTASKPEPLPSLLPVLSEWRKAKAAELMLPPYMVLQQKALTAIAINRPTTISALKKLPGIGPKTIENYGEEIINIVMSVE